MFIHYLLFFITEVAANSAKQTNSKRNEDEHITRTRCRKGTPSPLGQFSHLQPREERVPHPRLHQRSWQHLLQGNPPL